MGKSPKFRKAISFEASDVERVCVLYVFLLIGMN